MTPTGIPKVLLLARHLDLGGSERQLTEMARRLGSFGIEPHVACFLPGGIRIPDLTAAGVPVECLEVSSFGRPCGVRGARRLAAYVRRHNIAVVHTFDWPGTVFAVPPARLFTRAAVLSSQRAHRDLTPPAWRPMLRVTDHLAHGIVVNCEFIRHHLAADYGVPGHKMRVCYNGIDRERFNPGGRGASGAAPVVVGTVCALRPEKSLETLISAFAVLRQTHPDVRLRIIGDGACLPDLRCQAGQLGIPDSIFEPGTRDAAACFRGMDIMVLPSRSEALSNSLMEAMACGCCVVASRVGGNPELVEDGVTGALFEPGSSEALASVLRTLVRDRERCRSMGASAAAFIARNFSLDTAARRMAGIYREFLAGRTQSAGSRP